MNILGESSTLQKRFDAGIAGFVSYEFNNRVILCLNYQHGIKNISDDPDEDLWNRCLTISVGLNSKLNILQIIPENVLVWLCSVPPRGSPQVIPLNT